MDYLRLNVYHIRILRPLNNSCLQLQNFKLKLLGFSPTLLKNTFKHIEDTFLDELT